MVDRRREQAVDEAAVRFADTLAESYRRFGSELRWTSFGHYPDFPIISIKGRYPCLWCS